MVKYCSMCAKRKPFNDTGVYLQGEWYCNEKCKHGGKALKAIDELVDLIKMSFGERNDVMKRVREKLSRTMELM